LNAPYLKNIKFPIFPIFNSILKKEDFKKGQTAELVSVALPTLKEFQNIQNQTFPKKYQLWGLSLRMIHNLFELNGLPKICEERYFSDNLLLEQMLNQTRDSCKNSKL
jgi:hypothetical protein